MWCGCDHKHSFISLLNQRQVFQVKNVYHEYLKFSKHFFRKFRHTDSCITAERDHLACTIAFSPSSGRVVTTGGYHGDVCGHDSVSRKKLFQQDEAHLDIVNDIVFTSERQFATASSDRTAKLWDIRKISSPVLTLTGHTGPIKSLGFDQDTSLLLTTSLDGTILYWNLTEAKQSEDNLLLKCKDIVLSCYSGQLAKLVFCTNTMVFVINNTQLRHIPADLNRYWKRGVFTGHFREHGTWVSTLHEKRRNNVFAFTESECTPFPESKTNGFHSLAIHPTEHAMVSAISVQQGFFGSISEYVVMYDISRNGNIQDPTIHNLLSAGNEITQHKLRYYSPMKRFRRSQIPSEVIDRQKKLAISYCGRVIAAPNVDNVDLLATSPEIDDLFDDSSSKDAPSTALGLLERIFDKGPSELHKVCELPVTKGTVPLCCKFSPCDMVLAVSGQGGQIAFYEPRL
ncbi:DDB1- and CUL4-associated factor 10-like [Dysidea avara]|uniref:DDB1- and CUL4-associated factor 10-like n=1 Tax=Dysidea avara TaxID=196820 RepID=UPI0033196D7F